MLNLALSLLSILEMAKYQVGTVGHVCQFGINRDNGNSIDMPSSILSKNLCHILIIGHICLVSMETIIILEICILLLYVCQILIIGYIYLVLSQW